MNFINELKPIPTFRLSYTWYVFLSYMWYVVSLCYIVVAFNCIYFAILTLRNIYIINECNEVQVKDLFACPFSFSVAWWSDNVIFTLRNYWVSWSFIFGHLKFIFMVCLSLLGCISVLHNIISFPNRDAPILHFSVDANIWLFRMISAVTNNNMFLWKISPN